MKAIPLLWFGMLAPLAAVPADTTLTLVNEPGFNKITATVSPGPGLGDTDTTTLTGTVAAALDIDPQAGTTVELTLSNGRAYGTNMNFSRNIFFNGYNIDVTNLSAAIETIAPPGTVDPANGQFAAGQHQFEIDQGTLSGGTFGSLVGNTTINESFTPENSASGTGTGTGSITLTPAGDSDVSRTFEVTVILPVAVSDTFTSDTTEVSVVASGTIKATGTVEVPLGDYLGWTVEEDIAGAAFDSDPDGDGVPLGILWALGLGADADPRPFLPRPDPDAGGGFTLSLPPAGTRAGILIQSSGALGGWEPAQGVSAATNPLPPGSTGTVTIPADGSERRFIRLHVTQS